MSLLRNALKSSAPHRILNSNRGLPLLLLRDPPSRPLSTESEQSREPPLDDPIPRTPKTGLAYGRLSGMTKFTLKTDIVNLLEGCNLTLQDVKVDYNRSYAPVNMMLQFPSQNACEAAFRIIARKGRLYKLERVDRSLWDSLRPYDGKFLLLEGIPRNALQDDVERFLSGFDFDASSIQMFYRPSFPDTIRMALIRFPSQTQATSAALMKNRQFCLNSQVSVRVLQ